MDNIAPKLSLTLELHPSLATLLNPGSLLNQTTRQAIGRDVGNLMAMLGIPGNSELQIAPLNETAPRFMRLSVDNRLARYPDELLLSAYSYFNGTLPDPEVSTTKIQSWLSKLSVEQSESDRGKVVEFLNLTCLEIIKQQPAILLGVPQAAAYAASLPAPTGTRAGKPDGWPPDPMLLISILGHTLNLRLSIANKEAVAAPLHKGWAAGRAPEDITEDLIAALSPNVVEIQLPPDDLREVTVYWQENSPEMFPFLRDGMFSELGLVYPKFRFACADHLKPNSFSLAINDLTTTPLLGLEQQQCLVNDTVERLKEHGIQATATTNPATGQPAAVIDLSARDRAETQGLTTWNQLQFLILCMGDFLRKHAGCFINHASVQDQLNQLELVFPALVKAVRSQMTDERITAILRELIREKVSIRNLRLVMEQLLDYGLLAEPHAPLDLEEGHRDQTALLAFVRAGLRNQISYRAARSTETVVVYLLDPKIEELTARGSLSALGEEADKILAAVRSELAHLPPTAMMPIVLTSSEARPVLQELIASEFPRTSVIAHDELPPQVNVMPVARISLST